MVVGWVVVGWVVVGRVDCCLSLSLFKVKMLFVAVQGQDAVCRCRCSRCMCWLILKKISRVEWCFVVLVLLMCVCLEWLTYLTFFLISQVRFSLYIFVDMNFPAGSSVGRAMDCSSIGHVFNSHSTETGLIISYKHYNKSIRLSGLVV